MNDVRRPVLYKYFEKQADEILAAYQKSKLQAASANVGENRELFCEQFLKRVLPPKLNVAKGGEAWDSKGSTSGQLDVLIYRDDSARLYFGESNTYLAEGLFAVIEVKSFLNREKLREAVSTLRRVKELSIVPSSLAMISGPTLDRPLRLVFAYESANWENLADELKQTDNFDTADLISVLNRGVLATKGRLLTWESDSQFTVVNSKAAALAWLYYYLYSYGTSFLATSPGLGSYFTPINAWNEQI